MINQTVFDISLTSLPTLAGSRLLNEQPNIKWAIPLYKDTPCGGVNLFFFFPPKKFNY